MISTQRFSTKIKVLAKSQKIADIRLQANSTSPRRARRRQTLQTPRMDGWAGSVGAFEVTVGGRKVDIPSIAVRRVRSSHARCRGGGRRPGGVGETPSKIFRLFMLTTFTPSHCSDSYAAPSSPAQHLHNHRHHPAHDPAGPGAPRLLPPPRGAGSAGRYARRRDRRVSIRPVYMVFRPPPLKCNERTDSCGTVGSRGIHGKKATPAPSYLKDSIGGFFQGLRA